MARCERCAAAIVWLHNDKTNAAAPIDLTPSPEGNITIDGFAATYHVLTKKELAQQPLFGEPEPRYMPHFATCPEAEKFRSCRRCHQSVCVCSTMAP